MDPFSRRGLISAAAGALTVATAAQATTFGNPDAPPEGAINAGPQGVTEPGPKNPALAAQFPSVGDPPATDVGGLPMLWSSFNIAHKRIQAGGWARQVTTKEFAVSTTIAGVNMRLSAGGIRELHWHQQAEWGFVTNGTCRITVMDEHSRPQVADVGVGGLWYFPAGLPHSLQGLGPDGTEFILAFDNGASSENNTLLVTDWLAHTPPDVLAKNFGVKVEDLKALPQTNKWIFQGDVAGPLADDQKSSQGTSGTPPNSFVFDLAGMTPVKQTRGGTVRIADSTQFHVSKTIAVAMVTVQPGGMREMHWHPNADEWQYYVKGKARMTVFNTGPEANTFDFTPGDIGYVPKSLGHYIENTGSDELVFLEVFRAERYAEISLTDWLVHSPPHLVAQTLNIPEAVINSFPRVKPDVVPT
jgi:oxalate decarboxylase